jgi:hypothetical protein
MINVLVVAFALTVTTTLLRCHGQRPHHHDCYQHDHPSPQPLFLLLLLGIVTRQAQLTVAVVSRTSEDVMSGLSSKDPAPLPPPVEPSSAPDQQEVRSSFSFSSSVQMEPTICVPTNWVQCFQVPSLR